VSLHIYTHVREDALMLFGFYTPLEKEIFTMLISVSGIGPKLATNILSGIGPEELLEAMARGDTARMQSIPGIGKKTSERIALELRERAVKLKGTLEPLSSQVFPPEEKGMLDDAASALLNLGYSAKSAKDAVERARSRVQTLNLQSLIKEALRALA
jgi:Holliday junction DNA helicase RuvA